MYVRIRYVIYGLWRLCHNNGFEVQDPVYYTVNSFDYKFTLVSICIPIDKIPLN